MVLELNKDGIIAFILPFSNYTCSFKKVRVTAGLVKHHI